ncbi:sensor histidine kinase [Marmoricola sp. RAF53]|uniref:sensor histidine kinase n=1 Tax=Marmoricola sp. RAF53 TaxID=3233059 RepID=UPI003F9B6581
MSELNRVAAAARVFTLVVIAITALVGDVQLDGVWWVAGIAAGAQVLSLFPRVPPAAVVAAEGGLTAVVAVVAYPAHEAAMPYLATPALIAGITGGLRPVILVLLTEAGLLTLTSQIAPGQPDAELAARAVTWLATGIGLGLLGTITRRNLDHGDDDVSYRSALELIRQLHALSGRLTSGLDPVDLADQTLATVADDLVVRQAVVVTKNSAGDFVPLRFSTGAIPFALSPADDLLRRCWRTGEPITETSRVVLPLSVGSERVAIVLVDCVSRPDNRSVGRVLSALENDAVRLNAALLFASVRESAVSEERHRIAREVHDGIAQDVASLGYLIDNLAGADGEDEHVTRLRREVTRVVKELRNSVFDLRNDVASAQGLGQSIASFARHVGSHSELTVHVTLDESTIRLRQAVEAELLRITQEAINNARRHSGGQNLWVNCTVDPPYVSIEVIDDGDGLGAGRADSHGLQIMRERADRIGADLVVESPVIADRGTRIIVRLD